jgi:hypothetical protein
MGWRWIDRGFRNNERFAGPAHHNPDVPIKSKHRRQLMFKCLSPGAIGVKATLAEGLTYARTGGFQGLDVNIREVARLVSDKGSDHVTGLFSEAGMKIGAWGLPVAWNGPREDYDMSVTWAHCPDWPPPGLRWARAGSRSGLRPLPTSVPFVSSSRGAWAVCGRYVKC